ncbi:piggyBac transposable element-derived protein 3-like [Bactrocera dorsalis]|uniref:PiggyBac transposable element-derived protein 3-like n=1 Tax=Bactrocera dorsalis TaxID=27457 RepID=A0ABM3JH95_BACDO|nr:piggyBac transposable element-derived protein 3-like [Bactrocera dorsalis]
MSYRRFLTISRYIRFDDGRTRPFRLETDKAASMRDIWNFLNTNLQKNFRPYSDITVDEQLFPYRGRTKFTQYIPSKPAKYGTKVWWACDAKTHYPLSGNIYTGKKPNEGRAKNQEENELIRLVSKYSNSGRTIVADNFFSTLNLCKRLISLGLSFVGTIRSNKACIPPEMKQNKIRAVLSSEFGFHQDNVAICSYVPKKNKAVILLSRVHYDKEVEGVKRKPAAIMHYNKTKVGIDAMDQMLTHYTTKRKTKRWTLAFFYNIVDVMALGSFIICKENNNYTKSDARRKFLYDLSEMLAHPQIESRRNNIHVIKHSVCRSAIEDILGKFEKQPNTLTDTKSETLEKKRNCSLCHSQDKHRRKTRFFCQECADAVCQQHSKCYYKCFKCIKEN